MSISPHVAARRGAARRSARATGRVRGAERASCASRVLEVGDGLSVATRRTERRRRARPRSRPPAAAAAVELPGRGTDVRPRASAGPPGAPTRRAAARLDGHRRPQLVPLLRRRSASTSASSPSTTAATARGIRSRQDVPARGLRRRRRRRCPTCSGIDRFIAVGYSMGGPIAQLLWRRHPERGRRPGAVRDGGVLLAPRARSGSASSASPGWPPSPGSRRPGAPVADRPVLPAAQGGDVGAVGDRAGRRTHDWRMVLEAGRAIGSFSSRRRGSARSTCRRRVVITMRDAVVPVRRQIRLFESIPDAEAFRVDGDHDAVVANAERSSCRRCSGAIARRSSTERAGDDDDRARGRAPAAAVSAAAAASPRCAATFAAGATSTSPASALQVGGTYAVDRRAQAVRLGRAPRRARPRTASCAPPSRSPSGSAT